MDWKNRIVRYGQEPASSFLANEKNWRVHPMPQQQALSGALDQIGWITDVIVNIRSGGEWPDGDRNVETLVDGHLRVSLALSKSESTPVPVKYVDLSPHEEALALATFDPISAMAVTDKDQLAALLHDVDTGSAAVQAMLSDLSGMAPMPLPALGEPAEQRYKEQYGVIVVCDSEASQQEIYDRLHGEGYNCKVVVT